jgi:molybdopterin-guanine dinucleotide biosynthesis protein A
LDISCIILAGGKSTRFGHDKVLERIGNTSLLEQVISHLDPVCKDIIIVTAKGRTFAQLANRPKINIVSDILPEHGSLGGIYTGLVKSKTFHNLVVAADMPFLNESLLRYMVQVADGYDCVLPRVNDRYEPLHAIYSRDCIDPIKTILDQGEKSILELYNYVKVRFVETEEIDRYDPKHTSFFNINTKEDMEQAIGIIRGNAA